MNCPVCGNKLHDASELLYPASATEPEEYTEFDICISCMWSSKPVKSEEIPF